MLRGVFFIFVWFFASLTFAISIGISGGYGIATSLLLICSASLVYLKPKWPELTEDDRRLFYTFLAFGLSMFFFVFIDDFQLRDLDRPSRFILVLPVLLLLLQEKNRKVWLWYGVVIGAIFAFGLAWYERFILGYVRAEGGQHPIMFGDTGMLLGMLSFASSIYFLSHKRYFWLVLSLIAGGCGVGASVLSASRGGWVALPLIGFFLYWQSRFLFKRRTWFFLGIVTCLLIISAVLIPQTGVKERIDEAFGDISHYASGVNKDTSVGLRFEMWKAAFYMFQESPVLGAGMHSSIVVKKELLDEGLVIPEALAYDHAHNEYINALGYRGIVGLAFLLLVYLVPLRLFLKKMDQYKEDWNIKSYAMAGALVPMCYMDFGLSQVMFAHNIGVMMYAFPIVYFWAAVRWAEKEFLAKTPIA
ncbi:O-antigen ligase family protein [Marinomonas sp.]|uniref:O-antigen ligase family protein n=1 Tax=Marinomonas sp. TaxID=1904862 RepID=UPI003BAA2C09